MRNKSVATVVDKLVEFVYARGPTSMKDAAKALSVSESQIEDMANVLSDSGMIRVRYTITGAFLEPKPEQAAKVGGAGRAGVKTVFGLDKRMKAVEKELWNSERSFHIVAQGILKHIRSQKAELKRIFDMEGGASPEELGLVLKDAAQLEKSIQRFELELQGLRVQLSDLTFKLYDLEAGANRLSKRTSAARGEAGRDGKRGFFAGLLSRITRRGE